jgi:cob(I)alamin adenosyltransferase
LIVRTLGAGGRVCLIQFLKANEYSEIRFLRERIDLFQYGSGDWVDPQHPADADRHSAEEGLARAGVAIRSGDYDLIVLDEVLVATAWKLVSVDALMEMLDISTRSEIVLTGRYADPRVIDRADLVTEMREVKHYFRKGVPARPGIEY